MGETKGKALCRQDRAVKVGAGITLVTYSRPTSAIYLRLARAGCRFLRRLIAGLPRAGKRIDLGLTRAPCASICRASLVLPHPPEPARVIFHTWSAQSPDRVGTYCHTEAGAMVSYNHPDRVHLVFHTPRGGSLLGWALQCRSAQCGYYSAYTLNGHAQTWYSPGRIECNAVLRSQHGSFTGGASFAQYSERPRYL